MFILNTCTVHVLKINIFEHEHRHISVLLCFFDTCLSGVCPHVFPCVSCVYTRVYQVYIHVSFKTRVYLY